MTADRTSHKVIRPRVLAIGPMPPPVNGMSAAFELLVRGLREREWTVEVVDLADRSSRRKSSFTLRRSLEIGKVLASASRSLGACDVCYLTLTQSRVGFAKDLILLSLARAHHKPVVVHLHGGNFDTFLSRQPRPARIVAERALRGVFRFIVLSESLMSQFASVKGAVERTIVIENACPMPFGSQREPPSRTMRALFLSNLIVEKGYIDALDALALAARSEPDREWQLDLAGAPIASGSFTSAAELEADLRTRISSLPANAHATWHGIVGGIQKARLLAEAHVFVLPTYYDNEGQPIAILEALTAGLPVIATDYRSIPDTLPPEMRRLFVPARDPASIAQRLRLLARESDTYRSLSEAAIHSAARFRPEFHLDRIGDVLGEAAEVRS